MQESLEGSIEELMKKRGEQVVLRLEKRLALAFFRYAVGERVTEEGTLYSVYAEYAREEIHTLGFIPDFAREKAQAEGFCRLLAHILATPLSLDAMYEDSLTP